jgi:hypothetical protein
MKVFEFIALLRQYDPDAWVVVADDQEPELCNARELRADWIKPCALRYIHRDRAPKFVAGEPNAISVGPRTPEVWLSPKF